MAHTNETSNYELTQFIGSDKPAWLVDYNGDMLAIDTAMKAISDVADAAKSKADTNETNIATVTTTANSASAKASGAISDISDEYDPTSTYAVGDLVIYNNLLYKCTTAITVPEAFDGTHWTRTTIEELVDTINSNLSASTEKTISLTTSQYESIEHANNFTPTVSGLYRIVLHYHNDEPLELRVGTSSNYSNSEYIVNQPAGNLGTLNLICFLTAGQTYSIGTKYASGGLVDTNAGFIQRLISIFK